MRIRNILALATVFGAAGMTPLMGQPVPDSTRVIPAMSARVRAPNTIPLGPRLTPQFQSVEPRLAPSPAAQNSAVLQEGRQHTIVISTLALVLAVIIIVLVVAN